MRVLIFTHGKTGSTALAYRLTAALPEHRLVFEPKELPRDPSANLVVKYFANAPVESAEAMEVFDKRILLVRHPFDFIVSWILYIPTSLPDFTVARRASRFLEAVRNCERMKLGFRDVFRTLGEVSRVTEADLTFQLRNLVQIVRSTELPLHRFAYESLIVNEVAELEKYLGVSLPSNVEVDAQHEHVSRTRGQDNWRDWFDAEDVAYFAGLAGVRDYAELFGYDLGGQVHLQQIRDSALGSRYVQIGIDRNCARAGLQAPVEVASKLQDPDPGISQVALEETFVDVVRGARIQDRPLEVRSALLCLLNGVANPAVYHSVARCMNELGQPEAAELAALRAIAGNAAPVGPWHQLTLARSSLDKIPLAVEAAREVCAREPLDVGNFRWLGNLHAKLGQWREAELAYDAGAQLDAGDASYHRLAASALWEQGRSEDALARLDSARAAFPGAWELPYMAANILLSLQRVQEAFTMAAEAVALADVETPMALLRQIAKRRVSPSA